MLFVKFFQNTAGFDDARIDNGIGSRLGNSNKTILFQ